MVARARTTVHAAHVFPNALNLFLFWWITMAMTDDGGVTLHTSSEAEAEQHKSSKRESSKFGVIRSLLPEAIYGWQHGCSSHVDDISVMVVMVRVRVQPAGCI